MLLKTFFTSLFVFHVLFSFSQENQQNKKIRVSDFPEGMYLTLDDFLIKNVTATEELELRDIKTKEKINKDALVNQVFFYKTADSSKIKKPFAISFQGNLYIEQIYFYKYAAKGDRVYAGNNPYTYHRVLKDGNFLYLEGEFSNTWKQGLAANMGAAGGAILTSLTDMKGIVFDSVEKKFDMIRNCEDLNLFLSNRGSTVKVNCEVRFTPIEIVRNYLFEEISK